MKQDNGGGQGYKSNLELLESQIKFLEASKEQYRSLIQERDSKNMERARDKADEALSKATAAYIQANQSIEKIDDKMSQTMKTRAISDKLKQLES